MKMINNSKGFIIVGLVLGLVAAWTCTTATEMNTNSIMNIFGGDNPPGVGWSVNCYPCTSHTITTCVGCSTEEWTLSRDSTSDNTVYYKNNYCNDANRSCTEGYLSLWCDF